MGPPPRPAARAYFLPENGVDAPTCRIVARKSGAYVPTPAGLYTRWSSYAVVQCWRIRPRALHTIPQRFTADGLFAASPIERRHRECAGFGVHRDVISPLKPKMEQLSPHPRVGWTPYRVPHPVQLPIATGDLERSRAAAVVLWPSRRWPFMCGRPGAIGRLICRTYSIGSMPTKWASLSIWGHSNWRNPIAVTPEAAHRRLPAVFRLVGDAIRRRPPVKRWGFVSGPGPDAATQFDHTA